MALWTETHLLPSRIAECRRLPDTGNHIMFTWFFGDSGPVGNERHGYSVVDVPCKNMGEGV